MRPLIHDPEALDPEWLREFRSLLRAAIPKARASSEPVIFNGKFWGPIHPILLKAQASAEINSQMAEALRAVQRLLQESGKSGLYAQHLVNRALTSYEAGKITE